MRNGSHSHDGFDEAVRYYRNARELLAHCKVEDDLYKDMKPVQEAFGTAWLSVDKALKAALRSAGLTDKEIPRSWEALRAAIVKHLAMRNGKLIKLVNVVYEMIHLEGYYYGAYKTPLQAREAFAFARQLIETLSSRKIG